MKPGQELVKASSRSGYITRPMMEKDDLSTQIFAPDGIMALEHARQSGWEQAVVGMLCAVGGSLLAYWSLQGFIGLAVIVLCVAFSTLVTAALCHYYDQSVRRTDEALAVAGDESSSYLRPLGPGRYKASP